MAARTMDVDITARRLDELMRWHGTDESNLPPPHTLEHLSRDTIAALAQLQEARETILALRAAMGQAFWARDPRELRAIVLDALGPPPVNPVSSGGQGEHARRERANGGDSPNGNGDSANSNDDHANGKGTRANGKGAGAGANGARASRNGAGAAVPASRPRRAG